MAHNKKLNECGSKSIAIFEDPVVKPLIEGRIYDLTIISRYF